MKIWSLGLLSLFACSLIAQHPASAADTFHEPQTLAEKALSDLLTQEDKDNNIFKALPIEPRSGAAKDSAAARPFTKKFLDAVRKRDNELKQKSCIWGEGEACGLDLNPVLCAQSSSAFGYDFRTITDNKNKTLIMSKWREGHDQGHEHDSSHEEQHAGEGPIYKLVRDGVSWKLDGVNCGGGGFNMEE